MASFWLDFVFNIQHVFIIREQRVFFEQMVWKYEKCSRALRCSKRMNINQIVNKANCNLVVQQLRKLKERTDTRCSVCPFLFFFSPPVEGYVSIRSS